MKKFFQKNKYFLFMIIFTIIFLPLAISKESQGDTEFIITAIGIDYEKETKEFEVSIQIFMPTPSSEYQQNLTVLAAKDPQVSKAFNKIALRIGKKIGIAHCKAIILSDSVMELNISAVLDSIINSKLNSNNIILINTPDSSKEFLDNLKDIDQSLYFAIREEGYNKMYTSGTFTSIGQFYSQYLSKSKCSVIPIVSLGDAEELGSIKDAIAHESEGEKSGNTTGGEGASEKTINNEGKSAVVKEGIKVFEMTLEDTTAWNYFGNISKKGYLYIKDVNDDFYKNADVTLEVLNKNTAIKPYFKNGVPHYQVDINIKVTMREVSQEEMGKKQIMSISKFITPELEKRVEALLIGYLNDFIVKCKEHNADAMKAENEFYKYKVREYKKYKKGPEGDNFFDNIVFELDVHVKEQR